MSAESSWTESRCVLYFHGATNSPLPFPPFPPAMPPLPSPQISCYTRSKASFPPPLRSQPSLALEIRFAAHDWAPWLQNEHSTLGGECLIRGAGFPSSVQLNLAMKGRSTVEVSTVFTLDSAMPANGSPVSPIYPPQQTLSSHYCWQSVARGSSWEATVYVTSHCPTSHWPCPHPRLLRTCLHTSILHSCYAVVQHASDLVVNGLYSITIKSFLLYGTSFRSSTNIWQGQDSEVGTHEP